LLNLHQFFVIRSVFLIPFNLGLPYLVHTLMMEGKKGGSTVSTDSTVKPVLRGLPWEKEKCGFIRQVTS
jgi:hypothetical protein